MIPRGDDPSASSIGSADLDLAMARSSQEVNILPEYAIFSKDTKSNIRYKEAWNHTERDDDEVSPKGGQMGLFKKPGYIHFSSFNQNGIRRDNL